MLLRYSGIGILLLLLITSATAQTTSTYHDANWKKCDVSRACYLVKITKTDSGFYRQNYFTNNGSPQMAALYEDSASKTGNGYATYLYANGYLARSVKMLHGTVEGMDIKYYNNGQLSDSGTYHNGQPTGDIFCWHSNGYLADSITHINDSVFVHVSWFDDGNLAAAGREISGKKTGVWVFYHRNGNRAAKEMYLNGKRTSVQHFDESGNETAVDTTRNEHPATFKGGNDAWLRYLEKALRWPYGYSFPNVNQVALQVQVTIGEDGSIKEVYVMNPFHPAFDKEAYDVVNKSPKWMPAIQHNRRVTYRFRQSITFSQQ